MKHMIKGGLVVVALLVAPTAVQGQGSHIPATPVGITVAGVFQRHVLFSVGMTRGSITLNLKPGVAVPRPALSAETPRSVANLFDGSRTVQLDAQRTLQETLLSSGLPTRISQRLAQSGAAIAGGTAKDMVAGINVWNDAVRSLTPQQIRALLSTPEGVAMVRLMNGAANALFSMKTGS
jgi:hypothetical protein